MRCDLVVLPVELTRSITRVDPSLVIGTCAVNTLSVLKQSSRLKYITVLRAIMQSYKAFTVSWVSVVKAAA